MPSKSERIEARLSPDPKALFAQAAQQKGVSLAGFLISSACEEAKRTLQETKNLTLTSRDCEAFVKALLEDAKPNHPLKQAGIQCEEITETRP